MNQKQIQQKATPQGSFKELKLTGNLAENQEKPKENQQKQKQETISIFGEFFLPKDFQGSTCMYQKSAF